MVVHGLRSGEVSFRIPVLQPLFQHEKQILWHLYCPYRLLRVFLLFMRVYC